MHREIRVTIYGFPRPGRLGQSRQGTIEPDMFDPTRSISIRIAALGACGLLVASCSGQDAGNPQCLARSERNSRVTIPAGSYVMGENPHYPEEGPPRRIHVESFQLDVHEVTNAQFKNFVAKTGYRTTAERPPPAMASAPPEMLQPGSATFTVPELPGDSWWTWTPGADWNHPEGPGSTIIGKDAEPVVQISFEDAQAYAKWAGGALPTEEQWEYAARAGAPTTPEPIDEKGQQQANTYQGVFPVRDLGSDGYTGRAPVGCFKPNAFGLLDMIGNVWEWTSSSRSGEDRRNVIKGGSYLCAANYCARYRPAARQFQELDLGTNHIGFRLAYPQSGAPKPDASY
jgi:formylglycine-generating enzyme